MQIPNTPLIKKTIDYSKLNNSRTIDYRKELSTNQADNIIKAATDLISNPDFKPYFFNTLYMIGPVKFNDAMHRARQASNVNCQPCLFVKMLKEYRDQVNRAGVNPKEEP